MNFQQKISLLKKNFALVEKRHVEFFENGVPRWPGEKHDYLRNHHQNLDNFPLHRFEFDKLGCNNLPETIISDLKRAFVAADNGEEFSPVEQPS